MSIKSRIEKIEQILPKKKEHKDPLEFCFFGAEPSEEERQIAIAKEMELHPDVPPSTLNYIPYGFEHEIRAPRNIKVEWDYTLGFGIVGNTLYKLVKNYKKGWPYN